MQFNEANKTVVQKQTVPFFVLFFGDRARITGVGIENDPLEYVDPVGQWLKNKFKTDGHFPDSSVIDYIL